MDRRDSFATHHFPFPWPFWQSGTPLPFAPCSSRLCEFWIRAIADAHSAAATPKGTKQANAAAKAVLKGASPLPISSPQSHWGNHHR